MLIIITSIIFCACKHKTRRLKYYIQVVWLEWQLLIIKHAHEGKLITLYYYYYHYFCGA